ncbi:hypothetical protein EV644_12417 [Kribbella orskensis]|uniref:Uncharacterized protein n=1 Tax=Kribbella orskensis TaxID=2512216 RepID=A0ABY2B9N5_9ACTN|nr:MULTISPECIES: hypothetical protein [Kribbella]TCN32789.1 hypothetical protein EV642_12681 [Kribbella sp. VKM Ac-2500]TCO12893.1 hypothetical protein EV644_12417 [Kribbella orskensis]
MTAPELTIRRLSVTSRLPGAADGSRMNRIIRAVADHGLDSHLRDVSLPRGTWCVRRLDVPVELDLRRPDGALERAWAAALTQALLRALGSASDDVVHYDDQRAGLVDLIQCLAAGRSQRSWAWSRIGLLGPMDPAADRFPGAAIVAALRRHPTDALGVVITAVRRTGLPGLHRVLGPSGWSAVASMALSAAGASTGPAAAILAPGGRQRGSDAELARTLVAASSIAESATRSRLRPGPETVAAWAILVALEADASVVCRRDSAAVVAAVAQLLDRTSTPADERPDWRSATEATDPDGTVPPEGPQVRSADLTPDAAAGLSGAADGAEQVASAIDVVPSREETRAGVSGTSRDGAPIGRAEPRGEETPAGVSSTTRDGAPACPIVPERVGARSGQSAAGRDNSPAADVASSRDEAPPTAYTTGWGGLLFLLATADRTGIPTVVIDDPLFARRSLRWALQGIAQQLLTVTVDDPAVAAFAAVDPGARSPWCIEEPVTGEQAAGLATIAAQWAAVTADLMGRDGQDAPEVVAGIARRHAQVRYEPGWIELRLRLDEVDIDVRRAGLDLDPGWVPWLGAAVRFSYV